MLIRPPTTHLAPLAGDDPVVDPRRLVPTDFARDYFNLCWKRERRRSAQESCCSPPPRSWAAARCPPDFSSQLLLTPCKVEGEAKRQMLLSKGPEGASFVSQRRGLEGQLGESDQHYRGRESSCREATCSARKVEQLGLPLLPWAKETHCLAAPASRARSRGFLCASLPHWGLAPMTECGAWQEDVCTQQVPGHPQPDVKAGEGLHRAQEPLVGFTEWIWRG